MRSDASTSGAGPLEATDRDATLTRPSLHRLTSDTRALVLAATAQLADGGKGKQRAFTDGVRRSLDELSAFGRPENADDRVAIVHEVVAADTLAGISLAYGLSVR